jgi:hypothetical protein
MFKFKMTILSAVGWLMMAIQSPAQSTNAYPLTILETVENATGQLVVKGSAPSGDISLGSTTLTVVCKEDSLPSTGKKLYGILVDLKSSSMEDATVVDYDEMDALLQSVNYVSRADGSVSSLPNFSAGYTTKAGLRISAYTNQRKGQIKFILHGSHYAKGIPLSPDQLSKIYDLLTQAKAQIDQLCGGTVTGQN